MINNGLSASSGPSPSIEQKAGITIAFVFFFRLFSENELYHFFHRERQLSSKVIVHVKENTTSIHKVSNHETKTHYNAAVEAFH